MGHNRLKQILLMVRLIDEALGFMLTAAKSIAELQYVFSRVRYSISTG